MNRHGDLFDINQFTHAMTRFFTGAGDKNGGTEIRKQKRRESRSEKEKSEKGKINNNPTRYRKRFESSSEECETEDSSRPPQKLPNFISSDEEK